jgi:hypothetical protein
MGRLFGPYFPTSDDTARFAARHRAQLQGVAGQYAADPSIVGSTHLHPGQAFHSSRHCAARLLWRSHQRHSARFLDAAEHRAVYRSATPPSASSGVALALSARPGARRHNIGALQTKITCAAPVALHAPPSHANGGAAIIPKMHVVLVPGGGGIQSLQQQSGQGLKMLMILSFGRPAHRLRQHRQSDAGARHPRRSEVALRMALGAGRHRITRQIITESVLLSCIGGLAGLAVAYAGSRTILALAFPDARNMPVDASPSLEVLGFAFLVSLGDRRAVRHCTGVAFVHAQPAEALRGAIAPRATALRCRKKLWSFSRRPSRWFCWPAPS